MDRVARGLHQLRVGRRQRRLLERLEAALLGDGRAIVDVPYDAMSRDVSCSSFRCCVTTLTSLDLPHLSIVDVDPELGLRARCAI